MKRITTILLCAVLLLSQLMFTISCGTKKDNEKKDDNPSTTVSEETSKEIINEREAISDGLPDKKFDGYEFRIYTYSTAEGVSNAKYFMATEETGEVINDALYKANLTVDERFGVKIVEKNSGGDDNTHINNIKKSIKAGEDAFDLVMGHDIQLGLASLENNFLNLYNIPNINLSKPWWPKNTIESMTVLGNKMYIFSNSISYLGTNWTRVLFMNKDKAAEAGIPMPYKDVFDGTWTLDKLISMTKDAYKDLNGDGAVGKEDFFGYASTGPLYCSIEPFGLEAVKKDDTSGLVLNINSERTISAVNKMYSLIFESNNYFSTEYEEKNVMFQNNQALFVYSELGNAIDKFRFSDINYGILPMGKLDENQESYYAGCTDKLWAIPNTVTDIERTGIIVEAMSAEGYKKVYPAYYEIALKNKYLQDEESIKILDLISSVRVLDFSYIYCGKFNMVLSALFIDSKTPSKDFASFYEKNEKTQVKELEKLVAKFESME